MERVHAWTSANLDRVSDLSVVVLILTLCMIHSVTWGDYGLIIAGCGYAYLLRWRGDYRTELEEAFLRTARRMIPFKINPHLNDDPWFQDTSVASQILTITNAVNIIHTVLQGRIETSKLLLVFTILLSSCFMLAKTPLEKRNVARFFLRASLGVHAVSLLHRPAAQAHIKRFLVMRTLSIVILFDSILEGMIQLLSLSWIVALNNHDYSTVMGACMALVTLIVPVAVVPIRGIIAGPMLKRLTLLFPANNGTAKTSRDFQIHFWIHMVISVIPLMFIVTCFGMTPASSIMLKNINLAIGSVFFARGVYLVGKGFAQRTTLLTRVFSVQDAESADRQVSTSFDSVGSSPLVRMDRYVVFNICWTLSVCSILLISGSSSWIRDPKFGSLVMGSTCLLFALRARASFQGLILVHAIISLLFAKDWPWMSVAMAASRMPIALADEIDIPNCITCMFVLSSSIFQLCHYGHYDVLNCLVGSYLACAFGMVQKHFSQYLAQRLVIAELDSDSFFQHAVKQKLAAIVNSVNAAAVLSAKSSSSVSPYGIGWSTTTGGGIGASGGRAPGTSLAKAAQTIWEEDEDEVLDADDDPDELTLRLERRDTVSDNETDGEEEGEEEEEALSGASLNRLFKSVVFEAHLRHQDCHFLNIVRSLKIGRGLIWKSESRYLDEVFSQFANEMHLLFIPIANQFSAEEDGASSSYQSIIKALNSPSSSTCSTMSSRWNPMRSSTCSDASTASVDSSALQLRLRWELVELVVSRLAEISNASKDRRKAQRQQVQYEVTVSGAGSTQTRSGNGGGGDDRAQGAVKRSMLNLVLTMECSTAMTERSFASSMSAHMEFFMEALQLGHIAFFRSDDHKRIRITFHTESFIEEDPAAASEGSVHHHHQQQQQHQQHHMSLPPPLVIGQPPSHHLGLMRHGGRRRPKIVSKRDSDLCPLPSHLVFAILDDVQLVRRILLNLLLKFCEASMDSYSTGNNHEEATAFPEEVMQRNPDVVIIDQNLSYQGSEDIFGLDIAKQLRSLGFKGCIVLYSADNAGLFESETVIDGFLEKGVHRNGSLRPALASAWAKRMKRS